MKDHSQSLANWATVASAVLALVAIILSLISYMGSHDAISVAEEANKLASESNRIAQESAERGRGLIPAVIYVNPFEEELTLASIEDLNNAHIGMMVINIGRDSIDMVRMQAFTIFTLKDGTFIKQKKAFADTHEQFDCHFTEHVRPGGMAKADLTTTLLKLLATADFGNEGDIHTALFNIKCTGRPVGYEQPTGVGLDEKISSEEKSVTHYDSKDRDIIKINWYPKTLSIEQIVEYAGNYQAVPWISNK